ncbi:PH domain-containing protein [Dermatophilus congolensis]|uniref:Uncharacterized protein n=1 Tax=Dermatophilus congolensis TaxID=1863 RepID=A0A239VD74_9MICO|nr:PH domain-containing protein [Dermatophilus congolensis]MBO3128667.1 hypothetical protein [Dermatophilus congolensis]MBO3132697.1 hypothetical protein [Dermatophilus congolensis]MBO3133141.1 hypothetical protein [Dermatophilus congolensis]MBO3135376.1 hypothetical protein [Dermatophilus congolensis]MBO3137617.1 hypothetical protein [Dermatophilus congolensis]
MNELRGDIAEALARMEVTFGTRTAIRDLHESLEDGETVVDMVGCQFASGNAVLVLTNQRVMALRDDISAFRMRAVNLPDIKAVDYAPRIHDGLGILTDAGRIAVRKMSRRDADRIVDGILIRCPNAILGVSRPAGPGGKSVFHPEPRTEAQKAHPDTAKPTENTTPTPQTADEIIAQNANTDEVVLMAVLADLHAKGLLTSEELAAKIAQLSSH